LRIKPPPPELDKFDAASEEGGDKDLAERLTQLLQNLEHGSVSIFDGRWGIGKTTFVRRWLAQLRRQAIPSIYLDAFAVDYMESPFVAIAGAFAKAGDDAKKATDPAYTGFLEAATKVGKTLGGTAAKIGVKAVTLGLIGSSEIEELAAVKDSVSDALSETAESAVKEVIEEHSRKERELSTLKDRLAAFPALLAGKDKGDPEVPPLVVVIDELDRCRPDFALGMVESIKHFFGADGVHFVLVTNRDHLVLSVAHRYGSFPTADEYLRKFYDFQIVYEQDYSERGSVQIRHRVSELARTLLAKIPNQEREDIAGYVRAAATAHRLTLRDIEGVFLNLTLSYAAVRSNQFKPAILVTMLSLLKTLDPGLYAKAKAGTLSYDVLAGRLFSQSDWGSLDIQRVRDVFAYYLTPNINEDEERFRGLGQSLWNFNLERTRVISYLCNAVIDRFAPAVEPTPQPGDG
jgi:hypothetical protein